MREKIDKIVESEFGAKINNFCNSVWYPASYGAAAILSHATDLPILGAAIYVALLSLSLVFSKNMFTVLPFLLMCSFVLSEKTKPNTGYFNTPARLTLLCILLSIAVAAVLFNLIYRGNFKKIFKRAYLTVSIALLTGALVVGGFFAPLYSFAGVGMALAVGLAMFVPYSLLVNCGEYDRRKTVEYFAFSMMIAAAVIFAAVIQVYFKYGFDTVYNNKILLKFGHTISNSAAVIVLISIPMTFYLVYVYRLGYLFMLAVALELATIFLTFSRATLVIAISGVAIVAVVLCFKKKIGRKGYWITFGLAVAAASALAIAFGSHVISTLEKLIDGGSNGRSRIWTEGFEAWLDHPLFGVGLWYLPQKQAPMHMYHSYHCTPLTFLYCAGLIGLAAYIYHRYKTVRLFVGAKQTAERVFVGLTALALIINSLLDIYMTEPLHLLYYSVILALCEMDVKHARKVSEEEERSATPDINSTMIADTAPTEDKK